MASRGWDSAPSRRYLAPLPGFGVALVEPWGGFVVALWWLCTPESMPSICLVCGLGVALGGFAADSLPPTPGKP